MTNILPFQLTKSQRLLAKGTSQDGACPVLTGIHIRNGAAEVLDGCILVQKAVDYNGDSIILSGKQVGLCKDDKELGAVSFIPDKSTSMQAIVDRGIRTVELVSGTFPETEKLFPESEPVFKISLSKTVLSKFLSCLDEKDGENAIAFFFYGETSAVEFRSGESTRGLIMPMNYVVDRYKRDSDAAKDTTSEEK